MKRPKTFELVIGICLTFMSFTGPFTSAEAKPTGELRVGVPSLSTETFHPFYAAQNRKFYYEPIFDFLIGIDENKNLDPKQSIAYKWEEAPDHLSWTFYIRDGIKFHDGSPLTLEDVKYSLDVMIDSKVTFGRSFMLPYQDRVEIVPPNKIVYYMKKPGPIIPYLLSPMGMGNGVILPKKYLEEKGVPYFEAHPIGTGPYKFLEKKEGNFIKYEAQDSHWRVGTPKYKYLTFKLIPEEGTRIANLRSGEVDIVNISIARSKEVEAAGFPIRRKLYSSEIQTHFLRTYLPDNPLSNKKVRQALVYAIDKASILKHILLGQGELMGHAEAMFRASISYQPYPVTPYDPGKAKQLLTEAGYPNGFTIYLYSFATSVPEQKLVNETIAGYWEAIGMKVKILEMDFNAFIPIWTKRQEPPGPAAHTHSWSTRVVNPWRPEYGSDVKTNYFSQVSDTEMDRLIAEHEAQKTLEGFIQADRKCEERVLANYWVTGLVVTSSLLATSKEVPNWNLGWGIDSYRFEYIGATK